MVQVVASLPLVTLWVLAVVAGPEVIQVVMVDHQMEMAEQVVHMVVAVEVDIGITLHMVV